MSGKEESNRTVEFLPIAGSGTLRVDFLRVDTVDAEPAVGADGIYWLAPDGRLAGVEFLDVDETEADQTIETEDGRWVRAVVQAGHVTITTSPCLPYPPAPKLNLRKR